MNPSFRDVPGDGVTVRVAEWAGVGTPVLAIHGMTANCRCFDTIADAVAPRYRFLAVDLRGRGHSEKPATGYSIPQHCRDLEGVLNALGIARAFVLGHSLGAYIGLVFAAQFPERVAGLLLGDGGADLPPAQWAKVARAIKPSTERLGMVFPTLEAYLDHVRQAPMMRPWNAALETYFAHETETVPEGVRSRTRPETVREESLNLVKQAFEPCYGKIRCPVLILRATKGMLTDDDLVLPEAEASVLKGAFADARIVDLPGTDHYSLVFRENPLRDQAILRFLEACAGAKDRP